MNGYDRADEQETIATMRMLTFVMIYSATVIAAISAIAYVAMH